MPETPEFTEVVAGTPQQLFGAVKDHHEWLPKLVPQWFTQGQRHEAEGDTGSVHSVVHYDIHEDKHYAHGGSPKMKLIVQDYNVETLTYATEFQGDPRYHCLKFHIRFLPGPSPGTAYLKWIIEYSPVSPETTPDDELVNLPIPVFKDLAAHLENSTSKGVASHSPESGAVSEFTVHACPT